MQFFKHYTNMRHDIKIRRVIKRYGILGYGLYNLIIETIAECLSSDKPLPELEETAQDIAEQYHGDTLNIEEMMAFMVNQGLFELNEITGRILCTKMYKFLDKSQTRSLEIRQMITNFKTQSMGNRPQYVYIAHDGRHYKIGKSMNLNDRLKTLKTGNVNIDIILYRESKGENLEIELHRVFSDKRIEYEWFNLGESDIEKLYKKYKFEKFVSGCHETSPDRSDRIEVDIEVEVDIDKDIESAKTRTRSNKFIPPSPQEVQDYLNSINEKNFTGSAFCDFYQARGWMIGKNKMKDWKAAVRTWRSRKKTDSNDTFYEREQRAREEANKKLLRECGIEPE